MGFRLDRGCRTNELCRATAIRWPPETPSNGLRGTSATDLTSGNVLAPEELARWHFLRQPRSAGNEEPGDSLTGADDREGGEYDAAGSWSVIFPSSASTRPTAAPCCCRACSWTTSASRLLQSIGSRSSCAASWRSASNSGAPSSKASSTWRHFRARSKRAIAFRPELDAV